MARRSLAEVQMEAERQQKGWRNSQRDDGWGLQMLSLESNSRHDSTILQAPICQETASGTHAWRMTKRSSGGLIIGSAQLVLSVQTPLCLTPKAASGDDYQCNKGGNDQSVGQLFSIFRRTVCRIPPF